MIEWLYRVPPGDNQFPIWTLTKATNSGASTSVSAFWQNVTGQAFMLENCALILQGGAAQYARAWGLRLFDQQANVQNYIAGGELILTTAAVSTVFSPNVPLRMVVPPRWYVAGVGFFNAGAASNAVELNIQGWSFPRGNLGMP